MWFDDLCFTFAANFTFNTKNAPSCGLSHNIQCTDASENSKASYLISIIQWELYSAMINSLENSIHHPEIEIKPLKTVRGCPCGGDNKNCHTCNPLTLWNTFCSCKNAYTWWLPRHLATKSPTTSQFKYFICQFNYFLRYLSAVAV